MEIVFLGTSSMVPTKERNQVGILLRFGSQGILFDCGEGIQRQLKIAGIKITSITKIFISHWHGDHVLGLPGLVQTLSASGNGRVLEIYGPEGTKKKMNHLFSAFDFDREIEIVVNEVIPGKIIDRKTFYIEARELDHPIKNLGYRFVENDRRKINMQKLRSLGIVGGPMIGKLQDGQSITHKGKKILPGDVSSIIQGKIVTFITDTRLCDSCFSLAQGADILICESTYHSTLQEKAEEFGHMTSRDAGELAAASGVGKLFLIHFSARYKTTIKLEDDAKKKFHFVVAAHDFLKINV